MRSFDACEEAISVAIQLKWALMMDGKEREKALERLFERVERAESEGYAVFISCLRGEQSEKMGEAELRPIREAAALYDGGETIMKAHLRGEGGASWCHPVNMKRE